MSFPGVKTGFGALLFTVLLLLGFQNCGGPSTIPQTDFSDQLDFQTFNNGEGYQGNDFVIIPLSLCRNPGRAEEIRIESSGIQGDVNLSVGGGESGLPPTTVLSLQGFNRVSGILTLASRPDSHVFVRMSLNMDTGEGTFAYSTASGTGTVSEEFPIVCEVE